MTAVAVLAREEAAPDRTASSAARDGVATALPFIAGFAPFAFAIGAVASTGDDPVAGWAGSFLVFGGSAHLATLRGLAGSGRLVAVLTGVLVHTRLLIYSTSLARRWVGQPLWFRLLAAPLIIDPTWGIAEARGDRDGSPEAQRRFFASAALTLLVGWSAMIAVGAAFGGRLDGEHLAVAVPLCLASLLGPRLVDRETAVVCGAAAVVAYVGVGLPAGTGLLVAVVAGCIAGARIGSAR